VTTTTPADTSLGTLTDRSRAVLDAVRAFIHDHGYPPSLKELGLIVGIHWSTASYQLSILDRQGYIQRDVGKPRAIRILDADGAE
jgi:repressor LexA